MIIVKSFCPSLGQCDMSAKGQICQSFSYNLVVRHCDGRIMLRETLWT